MCHVFYVSDIHVSFSTSLSLMFIFPFCVSGRWGGGRALALSSDVRFPEWGSAQNPPPPPLLTDIKNKEIFPHILL
jgi:hypothetical protein